MRPMSLRVVALLLLAQATVLASEPYQFEVIARTGDKTAAGNTITGLGNGPSINDAGQVAYTLEIADGRQGVFVSGEPSARSALIESFPVGPVTVGGLSQNFHFPDVLEINNYSQVAWRVWSRDGLFSFIFRLGPTRDDFRIVANTDYERIDTSMLDMPSPFSGPFPYPSKGLHPWVALGNSGRTVFSGMVGSNARTVLATPRNPETSGLTSSEDYYFSSSFPGNPNLYPVVTNNDYILARAGGESSDPLLLYDSPELNAAWYIAESPDFTAIGEQPGISDDSTLVAFSGIRSSTGIGIYGEASAGVFKIAGVSGDGHHDPGETWTDRNNNGRVDPGEDNGPFSAFYSNARVATNHAGDGDPNSYTVAFLASGTIEGSTAPGPLGLYTVKVDVSNRADPNFSDPQRVVETTQSILDLPGTIDSITLYDPINDQAQLAFWVSTTTGRQAIVRTKAPILESFDANPHFTFPNLLPLDESSEYFLESLADFEPLGLGEDENPQVSAIAADGVSLLLLRVTFPEAVEGQVTFTLDHPADGPRAPLGTLWAVDSVDLRSEEGDAGDWDLEAPAGNTSVSVETFSHDQKAYAFALYRAPRNFDWDESAIPGASRTDRIRPVTIKADFSSDSSGESNGATMYKGVYVVRPPVLLVHGIWDSPSGWDNFPLWKGSANEENAFLSLDPNYPFIAYRPSYWINNDGRLATNARIILGEFYRIISEFRTTSAFNPYGISRIAAAQADVVTHSYGGPITRMAAQLAPDNDPRTIAGATNFRNRYNWGYGYIHKLITVSGPHKGSPMSAHTARVNEMSGGLLATLPVLFGREQRIHCGGLADLHVVSPVLQSLEEARFPCHAVVGSGVYENSVPGNAESFWIPLEHVPFRAIHYFASLAEEWPNPYSDAGPPELGVGQPPLIPMPPLLPETARRLVNYIFNSPLEEDAYEAGAQPTIDNPRPWPQGDGPNYDLSVRLSSMLGGLDSDSDAVTDILKLDPDAVGKLTHLHELGEEVIELPITIRFLLQQPAKSSYFGRFPAVADIMDGFDRAMMAEFPQEDVERDLLLGNVDACNEDELAEVFRRSENGVASIRNLVTGQ